MSALALVTAMTPGLGDQIRAEVEAAEADWQSALAHATRAGELLIEAKAACRHGEWLPWLEENIKLSRSSAAGYMRLANVQEPAHLEGLTIEAALKQLARPRERGPEESKPPTLGCLPLCDTRPPADPAVEAALRQRVREATAVLEHALTEREQAVVAYRRYAEGHKPGHATVPVEDQARWERENRGVLYGARVGRAA